MEILSLIDKIKSELKKQNITQIELAQKAGIPIDTLKNFLRGKTKNPRIDTIQAIEKALGINKNNFDQLEKVAFNDPYLIPLLGSVVAGIPIEAQEDLECYISCNFQPADEYFALRVHGDSMNNAGILNKSIIICHKQETAENGEIIVAMLNKEQTVKRYKLHGDNIYLMPENPAFLPIPITNKDELIILGKVVEIRIKV